MAILKKDFVRWYNQHSMGSKMDVAWAAIKMAEENFEGVREHAHNKRVNQCADCAHLGGGIGVCSDDPCASCRQDNFQPRTA